MSEYGNFIHYPKIRLLGNKENKGILTEGEFVTIQEKIDGANFRFMLHNGDLIFGSHHCFLGIEDTKIFNKQFQRCIEFIKDSVNKGKLKSLIYKNLVFFGEDCVKHSINYDWDKIPPYLGYDVFNIKTGQFLPYNVVTYIFEAVNLPIVPLRWEGYYNNHFRAMLEVDNFQSEYVNDVAEGIVIKNYKRQLFAKVKHPKFQEANNKRFGYNKKHAKSDNEKVLAMFCGNPRIEGTIFKLIDNGLELEMKMMKVLPKSVYKDMWIEHYQDIIMQNWNIDLKKLRKLIAERCVSVLNAMIINNGLNGD